MVSVSAIFHARLLTQKSRFPSRASADSGMGSAWDLPGRVNAIGIFETCRTNIEKVLDVADSHRIDERPNLDDRGSSFPRATLCRAGGLFFLTSSEEPLG
jgi:hypothetical protein